MEMGAGQFKAVCLKLMDRVKESHESVIITKHGKPVAKLVPVDEADSKGVFGFLKDSVADQKDIVEPIGEAWDADR